MARKVAVIGSGFGGLALAIRLQSAGIETVLLEKRDRPGGRAYVYHDQGFTFDAGPTVITAPNVLEELFEGAGQKLADHIELMPVDPLYRLYWEDGFRFDYTFDVDATVEQIAAKSPGDTEGYRRFLNYADEVFEEGYIKLAHVPFLDIWSMVRAAPQLIRLQAYRTVYSMVSHFIRDPQLRQAFSFHSLLVGGNPFSCSSMYTLIHSLERRWGVFFPRGGTHALVEALAELYRSIGGDLRVSAPVDEIVTRGGRVHAVRTQAGDSIEVDAVASNADIVHTYDKLLRGEKTAAPVARRLKGKRFSMSLFLVYFGVSKKYPDLTHHNVMFGSRYRDLLSDIFVKGHLADDFSLYLHAPTHSDPALAPPGGEAFYVLSPVPHLGISNIDWAEEGPRYADKILDYLEARYLPGLRENLVTQRIFTPLDFESELNSYHGSAFSLEPVLTQSAYFRTHNRDHRIGGLYFVGAGTHPGAGIPGVVNSAKATAALMLEDLGRS